MLHQYMKLKAFSELTRNRESDNSGLNQTFQHIMNSQLQLNSQTEKVHTKLAVPSILQYNTQPNITFVESNVNSGQINAIIKEAAATYHIDEKLISSVIRAESNFNNDSISHAGAKGLMQLMPETARELGVQDVFNPRDNIFGGTKYLRQMLERYDGDPVLALAAYNAGPGNVDKYGGVPPFKETQNYVEKVMNSYLS